MFAYPLSFWWSTIDKSGSSMVYENLCVVLDIFMMPHLIFISAFFIFFSIKNKSIPEYIKKRFFRLFIPIIIFTFCAGDIHYQILFKRLDMPSPSYFSTFLAYWQDFVNFSAITFIGKGKMWSQINFFMAHTWFLSVLFFMTLLVVFFVIPFRKNEKMQGGIDNKKKIITKTILLSMILGFLYSVINILFIVKGIPFDFSFIIVFELFQVRVDQFFMLLPLFLFGLYMYRKEWLTRGDIGDWKMWGILSAFLIFVYVLFFNSRLFPTFNEMFKIVEHNSLFLDKIPRPVLTDSFKQIYLFISTLKLPICIFLLMFFLTFTKKFFNKPNKTTAFCSKHSINVYLLHFIPVLILQYSFVDIPIAPIIKTILMFIIVVPSCLWLSYRFVYPYPRATISFFVTLKLVTLFAGFDFYYIALLATLSISFTGALFESMKFMMSIKTSIQSEMS